MYTSIQLLGTSIQNVGSSVVCWSTVQSTEESNFIVSLYMGSGMMSVHGVCNDAEEESLNKKIVFAVHNLVSFNAKYAIYLIWIYND